MESKDHTYPIPDPDDAEGQEPAGPALAEGDGERRPQRKYDSGPRKGKAVRQYKHQVHLDEIEDHKIRTLAEAEKLSISSTLRRLIRVGMTLYPTGFGSGLHHPRYQMTNPWTGDACPTKAERNAAEVLRRQELREASGIARKGRPRDPNKDRRKEWVRIWEERLRAAQAEPGEDDAEDA